MSPKEQQDGGDHAEPVGARELAARGEFVADIRVAGGRVRLIPAASSYVMTGDGDPSSWIYNLTTFGPSDSRTFMRHRDAVLHVLYGQTSGCPYAGVPPWASASLSGTLLAGIERQLSGEAGGKGISLGLMTESDDREHADLLLAKERAEFASRSAEVDVKNMATQCAALCRLPEHLYVDDSGAIGNRRESGRLPMTDAFADALKRRDEARKQSDDIALRLQRFKL